MYLCQGTWYESLRQKFKDVRRKETGHEQMKAMKEKYGGIQRKQVRNVASSLDALPRTKVPRVSHYSAMIYTVCAIS